MVTDEGLVKILDFGLAKLTEPTEESEASTKDMGHPQTKDGHIVGTAPYMSPEQAQGHTVDARSDIFSFGCVLYEMVAGRRAFPQDSMAGLLAAIIKEEPQKASTHAPSIPLDLEKLISRAMRKDPSRRFHSMDDVRVELQDIKDELDSGSFVSAEVALKRKAPRRTWLWAVPAAVVVVGIAIAGWLYFLASTTPALRTVPLTSFPGVEDYPALSPDGNQVAFTRVGEGGARDLYVMLVAGGEPLLVGRGTGGSIL